MPIYEYVCNDCGHELEALQKISDAALKTCPACEKESLKKKISAVGFRLSGSGWYETDFKSERKKNLAQADSSESGASKKDEGGKTAASSGEKPAKSDAGGGKKPGKSDAGGGKEATA